MIKKSSILSTVLTILLILLGNFVWNESLLYSQNNFLSNSHWESYKKNFYVINSTDIYSFLSRTLLAENHFRANKNLGNQFILSKESMIPKELRYTVALEKTGYLDLIFNFKNNYFEAFRVYPAGSQEQSFYYKAAPGGKFIQKEFYNLNIQRNGKLKILIKQYDNSLALIVNNSLAVKKSGVFENGSFGFYSGLQGVEIFNITALDEQGRLVEMPFKRNINHLHFYQENLFLYISLLFLSSLAIFFVSKKKFGLIFLKNSIFFFSLGVLWFGFDFYYYSKVPKFWNYNISSFVSDPDKVYDLERLRYSAFKSWFHFLGGEIPSLLNINKSGIYYTEAFGNRICFKNECNFKATEQIFIPAVSNVHRVAYFGGSFANFAGILNLEDSFFDKFGKGLNQELPNFEAVNFSISGIVFNTKVNDIKNLIERYNPDTVILSVFLLNDDFHAFNEFVTYLNARKIRFIYQQPLNQKDFFISDHIQSLGISKEFRLKKIKEKFFQKLKVRDDLYFIDSNENAKKIELIKKGLLWWDANHMTAFGQEFMATDLLFNTSQYIKKGPH
jgi:hypothetical protein